MTPDLSPQQHPYDHRSPDAWAWAPPRERIDVGAILRIAPALMRLPAGTGAIVELAVGDAGATDHYTLTIADGAAAIAQRSAADPDARVAGSQEDWVAALGPRPGRGRLRIEGNEQLALLLLDFVNPT